MCGGGGGGGGDTFWGGIFRLTVSLGVVGGREGVLVRKGSYTVNKVKRTHKQTDPHKGWLDHHSDDDSNVNFIGC